MALLWRPFLLGPVFRELGWSTSVIAAALEPDNKLRLRANTEAASSRGIFGAPGFFVGEEMFWGNDRLEDAIACAAASRQAPAI